MSDTFPDARISSCSREKVGPHGFLAGGFKSCLAAGEMADGGFFDDESGSASLEGGIKGFPAAELSTGLLTRRV